MADIKAEYLACPIRSVISRFGDKWSMLVLYSLHTSETGVLRFNELRRHMTDCSQKGGVREIDYLVEGTCSRRR